MTNILSAALILLIISGCVSGQHSKLVNSNSLASFSSEKMSFPIKDDASLATVKKWLSAGDIPNAAEFSCGGDKKSCRSITNLLSSFGIRYSELPSASGEGNLSLIYNRTVLRNCKTVQFGCAMATNILYQQKPSKAQP